MTQPKPTHSDLDGWPILPEGVEGVLHLRVPPGEEPPAEDCFVCEQPMDDLGPDARSWHIPGEGFAHGDCYEPEGGVTDEIPDCSAAGCTGPAEIAALEAERDGLLRERDRLRDGLRNVERDLAAVGSRASAVRRRVQELLDD